MEDIQKTIPAFSHPEPPQCPACGATSEHGDMCARCGTGFAQSKAPSTTPLDVSHLAALGLMPGGATHPAFPGMGSAPARPKTAAPLTRTKPSASAHPGPEMAHGAAEEAIDQELTGLAAWAAANGAAARSEKGASWALKAPAIACAIATSVSGALKAEPVVIALGLVVGVCVTLDGLYPRGQLHKVHVRAEHDLERLLYEARNTYAQAKLRGELGRTAPDILEFVRVGRREVAKYLKLAGATPGGPLPGDSGAPTSR